MGIRVHRNLSLKERQVYTFDNFKGVDFSTSPYKVAGFRATQAKNLIYQDGTVRKRNGWKSLCKLPSRINGLFSFEIKGEKIILCYAGKEFYRLDESDDRLTYTKITPADTRQLVDRRIQLFVNDNKAYIVGCGDYLVFGKWKNGEFELRRVYNNEDTYIPTTTINIDEDGVDDENRGTLDAVNLLSPYRRNEFLGIDAESGIWTVDTAIKRMPIKNDKGEIEYIANPLYDSESAINPDTLVSIKLFTYDTDGVTPMPVDIESRDGNLFKIADGEPVGEAVGAVDYAAGKITLNINTKPQEEDTSNIIVTFEKSEVGQEDLIANATIGTVFGGGGASNRLFISGNDGFKNVHAWSEMYDYTYFSDNSYDKLGSDSSAITGYVRVSDGTLLVFKERNGSDSTAYYITGVDTEEYDYRGDIIFTTKFYKKAGNISDTIYGKYATASLNGDNLILTQNGVKGLQLYENISVESYRVQERGRNINGKLLKNNLSDACGFVFGDKYYLSIGGVTYIADSRFTFENEEDISGSYNYEWWYWDNVDARVWCEIDNELYFGTNGGLICKFHDKYADITFQDIESESGNFYIEFGENNVVFNKAFDSDLHENDEIMFKNGNVFALFLDGADVESVDEEGYIRVSEEKIIDIYDGIKVYADRVADTGLELDAEYIVGVVDFDNLRFPLMLNGERVSIGRAGFRLCKKISEKSLYVTNIGDNAFQVKEFEYGKTLDLVIYNHSTPGELLATIKYKRNIRAEWYTPIYDLGSNMVSKTLLNITIATEPLVKGFITAGYMTRNLEREFITRGSRTFDFDDINFEDFAFENSFANSFTVRTRERNFNFIVVRYISDNQNSCAVNSITIRYKINQINKGVR